MTPAGIVDCLSTASNQFWILGRTFGALPAPLGFWIEELLSDRALNAGICSRVKEKQ